MCPVLHSHTGIVASVLDGTGLDRRPLEPLQTREPSIEREAWKGKEKRLKLVKEGKTDGEEAKRMRRKRYMKGEKGGEHFLNTRSVPASC